MKIEQLNQLAVTGYEGFMALNPDSMLSVSQVSGLHKLAAACSQEDLAVLEQYHDDELVKVAGLVERLNFVALNITKAIVGADTIALFASCEEHADCLQVTLRKKRLDNSVYWMTSNPRHSNTEIRCPICDQNSAIENVREILTRMPPEATTFWQEILPLLPRIEKPGSKRVAIKVGNVVSAVGMNCEYVGNEPRGREYVCELHGTYIAGFKAMDCSCPKCREYDELVTEERLPILFQKMVERNPRLLHTEVHAELKKLLWPLFKKKIHGFGGAKSSLRRFLTKLFELRLAGTQAMYPHPDIGAALAELEKDKELWAGYKFFCISTTSLSPRDPKIFTAEDCFLNTGDRQSERNWYRG